MSSEKAWEVARVEAGQLEQHRGQVPGYGPGLYDPSGTDVLTVTLTLSMACSRRGGKPFGILNGVQPAGLDREAPEFGEAAASAINAIETGVSGARVVEFQLE